MAMKISPQTISTYVTTCMYSEKGVNCTNGYNEIACQKYTTLMSPKEGKTAVCGSWEAITGCHLIGLWCLNQISDFDHLVDYFHLMYTVILDEDIGVHVL